MRRLAATLLVLLLATACGQLPRPFQPVDKSGNDLLHLKDRAGIFVQPVTRDQPGGSQAAAELMAAALRERNLPASTQARNRASRILTARASILRLAAGREEVIVYWELSDTKGSRIGAYAQRAELRSGAWQSGDFEAIGPVMKQAAEAIAAMVQEPRADTVAELQDNQSRLAIAPMEGVPGDGPTSLRKALQVALNDAGLSLAKRPEDGDILIVCSVILGPPQGLSQDVRISWALVRESDGQELGRIDQENRIVAGSLNGPWGATAHGIAQGAALGISELVRQLGPTI